MNGSAQQSNAEFESYTEHMRKYVEIKLIGVKQV